MKLIKHCSKWTTLVQVKKFICLDTGLTILDRKKEKCHLNTSYVKPVVKNGPSLKSDRVATDLDGSNKSPQYCLGAAIEISARYSTNTL